MYIKAEVDQTRPYILDIYLYKSTYDTERIARFNFRNNEGSYKTKSLKSFKTLENKFWREYPPMLWISDTTLNKAKQAGKQAQKQQNIIWEYEDIARKLKSEYNYTDLKLKELFSRAAEIEKYLIANNLQENIIMM